MFKNRFTSIVGRLADTAETVKDGSRDKVEEYVVSMLPTVRESCDRFLAQAREHDAPVAAGARRLSADLIADEKRFMKVLDRVTRELPLPRYVPRRVFVKICMKQRPRLLALVAADENKA